MEGLFPDRKNVKAEHLKENVVEFLLQTNLISQQNKFQPNKEIFLMGATNYPSHLDSAVACVLNFYISFKL